MPLYRVMRVDASGTGKKVWQDTRIGQGRGRTGPAEMALVPYRLPELLAGVSHDATVFVVEGEEYADALAGLVLIATTSPGAPGSGRNAGPRTSSVLASPSSPTTMSKASHTLRRSLLPLRQSHAP